MKRILLALLITSLTLFGAFFVTSCKSDSSGENNSQTFIFSSVSSTSSKTDVEQGNSSSSSSSFSQSLSETDSEQSKSSSSSSSKKEDSSQGHVHQMQHVARVEATGSTSGNVEYYHCVSCGKNFKDKNGTTEITDVVIPATRKITFKTLTVDENNNVYGKVPNSQTTYSFLTEVSTPQNVSYIVSLDIYGIQQVPTKTVPINVGDNVFYITETVGNDITLYTVTIRRRPVYTVTFNTNCSTVVENQLVEEDFFAIEPNLEKIGYTFLGWNYSFQNPITSDIQITASWSANIDTKYKVEYYLQNLKDDYYTLYETYNFSGTTDTTATAEQLGYEHFSFNYDNSLTSGNIDGDGSLVLKLYYIRNAYVLSNENTEYGEITNGNTIKYGASVTTCATEYLGCEFVGWYSGEQLLSTNKNYAFIIDKNVTAKFKSKQETSNLIFTADKTTFNITAIKDKTIKKIIIPDYTTSIGDWAFSGCSSLTSIIIPNNVTNIGDYAFYNCSSLTSIIIQNSVTSIGANAFYSCPITYASASTTAISSIPKSALITVIITSGQSILGNAFYKCSSLTNITIGNSVTSIENFAFYDCSNLENINYKGDINSWVQIDGLSDLMYNGKSTKNLYIQGKILTEANITANITKIPSCAFSGCSSLTSITVDANNTNYCSIDGNLYTKDKKTLIQYAIGKKDNSFIIPNSVTSIGSSAFSGCNSLTSVTIGSEVTNIGRYAFDGCTAEIKWGDNPTIKNIGGYAFHGYAGTSITIPNSVTSIGDSAFSGCSRLTSITIPNSVTSIGSYAFDGCHITYANIPTTAIDCVATDIDSVAKSILKTVIITSGESISGNAFYNCSSLTSVTIGNSVTSIGDWAFFGCSSLTSITIPDSVTSIGFGAFKGCSSLEEITMPFVGAVAGKTSRDTYQYPFGCIFGMTSYTGGTATEQYYYGPSTSSTTLSTYYVPASLKKVTVTGGNILYGAFYNCSSLTSVTIGNSVTSIGSYAFNGCSSLTSIAIPNSVTSIGEYAFSHCKAEIKWGDNPTITNIGENSFREYRGTSITIPNSVKGIGDSAFYNCDRLTSVTIGNSVTSIGEGVFSGYSNLENIYYTGDINSWVQIDGLSGLMYNGKSTKSLYIQGILITEANITTATKISDDAFRGCSSLTSITILDSVKNIGVNTFYNCSGLTNITIGSNVTSIGDYAFYGCSSLTSITILDGVKNIGVNAFYNCSNLTTITIPNSVTSIGQGTFYGCSSLEEITIPFVGAVAGKTSSDTYQYPFGYIFGTSSYTGGTATKQYYYGSSTSSTTLSTYYVPASLKKVTVTGGNILYGAFYNCSSLTSITIGNGVKSIGSYVFSGCTAEIKWGDNPTITNIGKYAFSGYIGTSVTIPNSVKDIGNFAFYKCGSLTSVTIGSGVTSIGGYAFYNCSSLTSVTIPDSVTNIGVYAFSYCTLTSITIGNSVTSIGSSAFSSCSSLTSITIPDSVTSIGDLAFSSCSSLTSITIGNSVTSIGSGAFSSCSSLTSITIGNSVTSIRYEAFYKCSKLKTVYYKGTQAEWEKISIEKNNSYLTNANIIYV